MKNKSTLPRRTLKTWITAVRPWSFPASAMPAILAVSYAYCKYDNISPSGYLNGFLALIGAILFQAAGNLINDYFDYKNGVDRKDTFCSSRIIVDGIFTPKETLAFGLSLLSAASLLGLFIAYKSGFLILIFGIAGIAGTYFYYFMKYRAMGEIIIFLIYGELIAEGTLYAITSVADPYMPAVSAPLGLLIVNILLANNIRDMGNDDNAKVKTFATYIGAANARKVYVAFTLIAYAATAILIICGLIPVWSLLAFAALPLSINNMKSVHKNGNMIGMDERTAKSVMLFGLLLCLANVIAKILR
ncbi:MAG: prenyltransferase [Bacteroidales bacterium]|jgi:1,4-dihydroxy-2-naphthoate octaprenyltransferase|nr:prenyltransferase [Bacteroidales bacterium]